MSRLDRLTIKIPGGGNAGDVVGWPLVPSRHCARRLRSRFSAHGLGIAVRPGGGAVEMGRRRCCGNQGRQGRLLQRPDRLAGADRSRQILRSKIPYQGRDAGGAFGRTHGAHSHRSHQRQDGRRRDVDGQHRHRAARTERFPAAAWRLPQCCQCHSQALGA